MNGSMVNWRGIVMGSKSGSKYTHRRHWGGMRGVGRSMSGSERGSKNSNRSHRGRVRCMGGSGVRYWGMSMVMLETELGWASMVRSKRCHMGNYSRAGGSYMDRVYHSWCRFINGCWVVHRSRL